MVTLKELENGNLQIILNDKEELETILERATNTDAIISDILDASGYLGNNWWEPRCIGLTEAPAIGYGQIQDEADENEITDEYEKVWYYPYYMIHSFAEILLEKGSIEFQVIQQPSEDHQNVVEVTSLKSDKGRYQINIDVNGIRFESVAVFTVPEIANKFNISVNDLFKKIR